MKRRRERKDFDLIFDDNCYRFAEAYPDDFLSTTLDPTSFIYDVMISTSLLGRRQLSIFRPKVVGINDDEFDYDRICVKAAVL